MRKLIAAINMTIDGNADHMAGVPDAELHQHYADLIKNSGELLYGRITYELMGFWKDLAENPSGDQDLDAFAAVMDQAKKLVFSNTLKTLDWHSASLMKESLKDSVIQLKQQPGKDLLVGSRSLIIQLMKQNLIDEYQFCIHPVITPGSLPLFEQVNDRVNLQLTNTKVFKSGAVILYYSNV